MCFYKRNYLVLPKTMQADVETNRTTDIGWKYRDHRVSSLGNNYSQLIDFNASRLIAKLLYFVCRMLEIV